MRCFFLSLAFFAVARALRLDTGSKQEPTESLEVRPGKAFQRFHQPKHGRCKSSTAGGEGFNAFQTPHQRRPMPMSLDVARTLSGVYFINVEGAAARRSFMEKQCRRAQLSVPCERFPAVDMHKLDDLNVSSMSAGKPHPGLNPSVVKGLTAIQLSNYMVMEHILKNSTERDLDPESIFMITEDDVRFNHDLEEHLPEILEHTPSDWMHLRVGMRGNRRCEDQVNDQVYQIQGPSAPPGVKPHFYQGNFAYLVKLKHIPHILKAFQAMPIINIEGAWWYWSQSGEKDTPSLYINSYAVAKHLAMVESEKAYAKGSDAHSWRKSKHVPEKLEPDTFAGAMEGEFYAAAVQQ